MIYLVSHNGTFTVVKVYKLTPYTNFGSKLTITIPVVLTGE